MWVSCRLITFHWNVSIIYYVDEIQRIFTPRSHEKWEQGLVCERGSRRGNYPRAGPNEMWVSCRLITFHLSHRRQVVASRAHVAFVFVFFTTTLPVAPCLNSQNPSVRWFVMCGVRFVTCGVWFVMRRVWFVMCVRWFVMCRVWFVMCGAIVIQVNNNIKN